MLIHKVYVYPNCVTDLWNIKIKPNDWIHEIFIPFTFYIYIYTHRLNHGQEIRILSIICLSTYFQSFVSYFDNNGESLNHTYNRWKILFRVNNRKTRVHTEKLYYIGKKTRICLKNIIKISFHKSINGKNIFCNFFWILLKEETYFVSTNFDPYYSCMEFY